MTCKSSISTYLRNDRNLKVSFQNEKRRKYKPDLLQNDPKLSDFPSIQDFQSFVFGCYCYCCYCCCCCLPPSEFFPFLFFLRRQNQELVSRPRPLPSGPRPRLLSLPIKLKMKKLLKAFIKAGDKF